jgi:hypothetical protein
LLIFRGLLTLFRFAVGDGSPDDPGLGYVASTFSIGSQTDISSIVIQLHQGMPNSILVL